MKYKTTQKAVKENFYKVFYVPYCGLQTLLNFKSPEAYTTRCEGWGCDVYNLGSGIALTTGYAPFGKKIPYELYRNYENKALKLNSDRRIKNFETRKKKLDALIVEFREELLK